ncbi:MAG: DUF2085 domain-containing protein [Acidobacteriota bacterium]
MSRERVETAINRAVLALATHFTTLAVAGFCLVFASTVFGPLLADSHPLASRAIHAAFRFGCHQIPERCLAIGPGRAPVCARCQAIYAGLAISGLLVSTRAWRWRFNGLALLCAAAPIALDGFTQLFGLRESNTPLRLATGLLWGLAVGLYTLPLVRDGMRQAAGELEETIRTTAPVASR